MTEIITFLQTTCAGGKSEDVHENHGENDGDGSRVEPYLQASSTEKSKEKFIYSIEIAKR